MALGHLGLQQGRKLGWTLTLQGGTFPRGFHGPFPSTDCTDTNFILQVLKAQKCGSPAAPPPCTGRGEGADPAMPVAVSSCGGVWGSGDPPTTGSLSPGPCPLLQAPVLGGGTVLTQG